MLEVPQRPGFPAAPTDEEVSAALQDARPDPRRRSLQVETGSWSWIAGIALIDMIVFSSVLALISVVDEETTSQVNMGTRSFPAASSHTHFLGEQEIQPTSSPTAATRDTPSTSTTPSPHLAEAEADTGEKRFICKDGQALPIVMGSVRKGASTTLWTDFLPVSWSVDPEMAKRIGCTGWKPCKENMYFYKPSNVQFGQLWGTCSSPKPGVIFDWDTGLIYGPSVPQRIKQIYGEKFQDIIFVWSLREPVKRMQSDFYSTNFVRQRTHEKTFAESCKAATRDWASQYHQLCVVQKHRCPMNSAEGAFLLYVSAYYPQIRRWLDNGYLPSQMMVFPGKLHIKNRDNPDTNPVVQALRSRLGPNSLNLPPPSLLQKENAGIYKRKQKDDPKLVDDMPTLTKDLYAKVFKHLNQKLFELLAENVDKGMTLVGYTGKAGDVKAVAEWMTADWDF